MASITSLTGSSSTSSIYGNSNILSGLASGMDTEAMIENAVSDSVTLPKKAVPRQILGTGKETPGI